MRREKNSMKEFYDSYGWQRDENRNFREGFEGDGRATVRTYGSAVRSRGRARFAAGGELFLDAGCGPLPEADHTEYYRDFSRVVCLDLSREGLRQARDRLGDRADYVVGDITSIPIASDSCDGVLCRHVLYHVPIDEQEAAVRELYRVLRPGGVCVIIYSWERCFLSTLGAFFHALRHDRGKIVRKLLGRKPGKAAGNSGGEGESPAATEGEVTSAPYVATQSYRWFRDTFPREWKLDIRSWRSADVEFTESLIPDNLLGRWLLRGLFALENLLPRLMARIGRHVIITIRKDPVASSHAPREQETENPGPPGDDRSGRGDDPVLDGERPPPEAGMGAGTSTTKSMVP